MDFFSVHKPLVLLLRIEHCVFNFHHPYGEKTLPTNLVHFSLKLSHMFRPSHIMHIKIVLIIRNVLWSENNTIWWISQCFSGLKSCVWPVISIFSHILNVNVYICVLTRDGFKVAFGLLVYWKEAWHHWHFTQKVPEQFVYSATLWSNKLNCDVISNNLITSK